jgi:hypothetical protein
MAIMVNPFGQYGESFEYVVFIFHHVMRLATKNTTVKALDITLLGL